MLTWADFTFPAINLYTYPKQYRDFKMSNIDDASMSSHCETTVRPIWKPKVDIIMKPKHYTRSSIETWDAIEAWGLNFNLGNVVKYISRAGHKGDTLEDLKKAKAYLDREINKLEGKA